MWYPALLSLLLFRSWLLSRFSMLDLTRVYSSLLIHLCQEYLYRQIFCWSPPQIIQFMHVFLTKKRKYCIILEQTQQFMRAAVAVWGLLYCPEMVNCLHVSGLPSLSDWARHLTEFFCTLCTVPYKWPAMLSRIPVLVDKNFEEICGGEIMDYRIILNIRESR